MPSRVRTRLYLVALALSALAGLGCDEQLSSIAGPTPTLEPTFTSISRDIFSSTDAAGRRACVSCHTNQGRTPAGGLNLLPEAAYAQLVGVASVTNRGTTRVIPGDPDNSLIVRKLEGAPGLVGQRMPLGGPPFLTPGQVLIVRRWIALGAPNN